MKKIVAWKTNDGKIWEAECAAEMHERKIEGEALIRNIYFNGMLECSNDLIDFLIEKKITVLKFYGLQEK